MHRNVIFKGGFIMKKFSTALLFTFMIMLTVVGTANGSSSKNIYETAKSAGNFSTLLAALDKANLSEVFKNAGEYTVFAPTDEAFEKFLKEKNLTSKQLLAHPKLGEILKYHVLGETFVATDVFKLVSGTQVKTLSGDSITITKSNGKLSINDAQVVTADIMASNGVIHVIDKVLIPDGVFEIQSTPRSLRSNLTIRIKQSGVNLLTSVPHNANTNTGTRTLGQVTSDDVLVAEDPGHTPSNPTQSNHPTSNVFQVFLLFVGSILTSFMNFLFKR
jgi:uncharacterized surface protein with fasciclin (FAS1) repeats